MERSAFFHRRWPRTIRLSRASPRTMSWRSGWIRQTLCGRKPAKAGPSCEVTAGRRPTRHPRKNSRVSRRCPPRSTAGSTRWLVPRKGRRFGRPIVVCGSAARAARSRWWWRMAWGAAGGPRMCAGRPSIRGSDYGLRPWRESRAKPAKAGLSTRGKRACPTTISRWSPQAPRA